MRAALAIALLIIPSSVAVGFDYAYPAGVKDVPLSAFNSASAMGAFASSYRATLTGATWQPGTCTLTNGSVIAPGETRVVSCGFVGGPTLSVKVRAPSIIDAAKPYVAVFPAWGSDEPAALSFVADGYVTVHVKFEDWFDALAPLYNQNGYLPVWGVIADRIMDQVEAILPAHTGEAIVSSATGSLVAPFYALYRSDVRSIVTNGVLLSLDWLRRNYRFDTVPNFWDHGLALSYTPIYLTMAPTPTQWQMGTADGFYPDNTPLAASPHFSGTPRDQTTDEVLGQFLVLEKGWALLGGAAEMHVGSEGHLAVDYSAALAFVAAH